MKIMKESFEKKIELLSASMAKSGEELKKKMREKDKEMDSLKQTNDSLYKRYQALSQLINNIQ